MWERDGQNQGKAQPQLKVPILTQSQRSVLSFWGATTGLQPLPSSPSLLRKQGKEAEAELTMTVMPSTTPCPCQCAPHSLPLPHQPPSLSFPDLSGIRSWSDCAYSASEME